jgi:hypothetical protein
MSTKRSPIRQLAPLYPAAASVLVLSVVADSALLVGVSTGLSIGILLMLGYWWARRPVDEWGER